MCTGGRRGSAVTERENGRGGIEFTQVSLGLAAKRIRDGARTGGESGVQASLFLYEK